MKDVSWLPTPLERHSVPLCLFIWYWYEQSYINPLCLDEMQVVTANQWYWTRGIRCEKGGQQQHRWWSWHLEVENNKRNCKMILYQSLKSDLNHTCFWWRKACFHFFGTGGVVSNGWQAEASGKFCLSGQLSVVSYQCVKKDRRIARSKILLHCR